MVYEQNELPCLHVLLVEVGVLEDGLLDVAGGAAEVGVVAVWSGHRRREEDATGGAASRLPHYPTLLGYRLKQFITLLSNTQY